ncbi:acyl-CoA thioesterase [Flavobacterium sp. ZT3R18]|uniref:acyl-CoA thioesterase n=1 Tax=Flavobacterium sp. ZT3R18 TaxID=2594429 RepID=UPI00117B09B0|nr:thioesterase family protein [Flavobacterium sp. ZT3R18]TRX36416.1 acyl-CoA thioesterase [Flavobacterium sp. ZT3R18]
MQNIELQDFKYSLPLNIRWNDLDPLNHVNNVYYFEYFQIGRGYYMPTASKQWDWTKNMFVIAHIECDYFKEIKITAIKPSIKIRTSSIGFKSFEIEYLITSLDKDGNEIIHAKGKSIQVLIDTTKGKSIEIPDWLRADLITYEPTLG